MIASLVVLASDPLGRATDLGSEQLENVRGAERVGGGPVIRSEALRSTTDTNGLNS